MRWLGENEIPPCSPVCHPIRGLSDFLRQKYANKSNRCEFVFLIFETK